MPNQANTHDENRKFVCLLCLKKCLRQLTVFQTDRICPEYANCTRPKSISLILGYNKDSNFSSCFLRKVIVQNVHNYFAQETRGERSCTTPFG